MYSINRMTDGIGMETLDECIQLLEVSSASATPFRIRITALRAVHTLIGSKEAFKTKTREFIVEANYSPEIVAVSKSASQQLRTGCPARDIPRVFGNCCSSPGALNLSAASALAPPRRRPTLPNRTPFSN
jgi:hypothetical protein